MKTRTIRSTLLLCSLVSLRSAHHTNAQEAARHIDVTARRFAYEPSELTLKKGEPVVIVLKSVDVAHGIRFKELGLEAKVDKRGTGRLAFTPTRTGNFVGHCSVFCGSGHGGMTLTFHVVD